MAGYYYSKGGTSGGPVSVERLLELYTAGELDSDTMVWQADSPASQPLCSVLPACPPPSGAPPLPLPPGLERPGGQFPLALLVMVLCASPLGLVGLILAWRTEWLWDKGRYKEAISCADASKSWSITGLVFGCWAMPVLLYILLMLHVGC